MDLLTASTFFDNDELYDAYTGSYLYDGQFATYEGNQLDGSFIRRRTVSIAPDLELPPRRVVSLYGEQWVLSDPIRDGFQGEEVRQTMSARKAHNLYGILSAGQLARGEIAVRTAYGFQRWTKNTADAGTSDLEPYYEFSFSSSEQNLSRKFLTAGDEIWHTRMAAHISEGFMFAEADRLEYEENTSARLTVVKLGALDPVTLQREASTAPYSAVMVHRYQFFRKEDQAQPNNYAGDMTLIVSKLDDASGVGVVGIGASEWTILAKEDLGDGWGLHIRRVT